MSNNKKLQDFNAFSDDESRSYLADHYPQGRLFSKINLSDSWIYKLVKSLSEFIKILSGDIYTLLKNRDLTVATELLTEWEESVKIPEEFQRNETLIARRLAVKRLVSKIPVYNLDINDVDTETTMSNYLNIMSGSENIIVNTLELSASGTGLKKNNAYFVIGIPYVLAEANNFPLSFPHSFGAFRIPASLQSKLNSLMEKIAPAFSLWRFYVIPPMNQKVTSDGLNKVTSDSFNKKTIEEI